MVLQPSAWWQHATGAVLSERRDLLQQEAKPKLNAQEQWRVRQDYTAAYQKMQQAQQSAAHCLGLKAWSGLDLLKVWAFADIPYLPGDLLIHLLKVATFTYKQGECLLRGLLAAFAARRFGQQCRVSCSVCHTCRCCVSVPALENIQMSHNCTFISQRQPFLGKLHVNSKCQQDAIFCAGTGGTDEHCRGGRVPLESLGSGEGRQQDPAAERGACIVP